MFVKKCIFWFFGHNWANFWTTRPSKNSMEPSGSLLAACINPNPIGPSGGKLEAPEQTHVEHLWKIWPIFEVFGQFLGRPWWDFGFFSARGKNQPKTLTAMCQMASGLTSVTLSTPYMIFLAHFWHFLDQLCTAISRSSLDLLRRVRPL